MHLEIYCVAPRNSPKFRHFLSALLRNGAESATQGDPPVLTLQALPLEAPVVVRFQATASEPRKREQMHAASGLEGYIERKPRRGVLRAAILAICAALSTTAAATRFFSKASYRPCLMARAICSRKSPALA